MKSELHSYITKYQNETPLIGIPFESLLELTTLGRLKIELAALKCTYFPLSHQARQW